MKADTGNWVGLLLAGRYQVLSQLGAGGMGFVYLAQDRQENRQVVVKVPRQAMLDDPDFAGRFTRETRSLIRLRHPHIVPILDVGEHGGLPFVVLEFLPGGSLRDRLGGGGPRPLRELRSWLEGIASALDFCHQNHCVHRDVKPDNILFDAQGRPYLSDFGIAKVMYAAPKTRVTVLTGTGMVLGTPQYMAPELILGEKYDGKVDQYGLAVTVYEVLSGRVPVQGNTPAAILVQQTTTPAPALHTVVPSLPRGLSEALQLALAKAPRERFPDCSTLAKAILAAADGQVLAPLPIASIVLSPVAAATPTIALRCPRCKSQITISGSLAGKRVQCPKCQATITITERRRSGAETAKSVQVLTPRLRSPSGTSRHGRETGAGETPWMPRKAILLGLLVLVLVAVPGVWFLLRTSAPNPATAIHFSRIDPDPISVNAGGTLLLAIEVSREGYEGPIELAVDDLPDQVSVKGPVSIPGEETRTTIELRADSDATDLYRTVTIRAKAGELSTERAVAITVVLAQELAKRDRETLQGMWKVVSSNRIGGEKQMLDKCKVCFDGQKLIMALGDEILGEMSYKVDASKNPKHLDVFDLKSTALSIYAFEGERLKIRSADQGKTRPSDFAYKLGDAGDLVVLERLQGLSPPQPAIRISAIDPDQTKVKAGETVSLTIKIARQWYHGRIELSAVLPDKVNVTESVVIPEGQSSSVLKLTAAPDATGVYPARILAKGDRISTEREFAMTVLAGAGTAVQGTLDLKRVGLDEAWAQLVLSTKQVLRIYAIHDEYKPQVLSLQEKLKDLEEQRRKELQTVANKKDSNKINADFARKMQPIRDQIGALQDRRKSELVKVLDSTQQDKLKRLLPSEFASTIGLKTVEGKVCDVRRDKPRAISLWLPNERGAEEHNIDDNTLFFAAKGAADTNAGMKLIEKGSQVRLMTTIEGGYRVVKEVHLLSSPERKTYTGTILRIENVEKQFGDQGNFIYNGTLVVSTPSGEKKFAVGHYDNVLDGATGKKVATNSYESLMKGGMVNRSVSVTVRMEGSREILVDITINAKKKK